MIALCRKPVSADLEDEVEDDYENQVINNSGNTEDECCETVGQCTGNTDATTDVACTAPKTAIADAGAGTTEDECCETPATSPQPAADASGSPRTVGGVAVLVAVVGAVTLIE